MFFEQIEAISMNENMFKPFIDCLLIVMRTNWHHNFCLVQIKFIVVLARFVDKVH